MLGSRGLFAHKVLVERSRCLYAATALAGALGSTDISEAQLIEDRAVGAVVALACLDQAAQNLNDCMMRLHAGGHGLHVALGQGANLSARSFLVAPKREQLVDLPDRQAERSGTLDEAQLMHVALIEDAVSVRLPAGTGEQIPHSRNSG